MRAVPELILRAFTNVVLDSICVGGSWGVAHCTPTNQKPSIAPIFVHSSAGVRRPKEKPNGVGGVFLTRGEQEVVAPAQDEATVRREALAVRREVMLQPAEANRRAVQREATGQPDGTSKGNGM
jgi:hypothetical protein